MIGFLSVRKRVLQAIFTGIAGTCVALFFHFFGMLETWETKTWDWRVRLLAGPGKATEEIRIILLDQNSLDWAQKENGISWPWPREIYTAIVNFCYRSGARSLALDVLFLEPSSYGVQDDESLGKAVRSFGRVAGAAFFSARSGKESQWPSDYPAPMLEINHIKKWNDVGISKALSYTKAALPIPEIGKNLAVIGHVNHFPDPDALFRRAYLFALFDNRFVPSLGLGLIPAEKENRTPHFEPGGLFFYGKQIRLDRNGAAILRFRGPISVYGPVSAASVIQSEIRIREGKEPTLPLEVFKNKYVLFGFSAPGLLDLRPTPVATVYPGVGIHATMLDNFLSEDFMRETPAPLILLLILLLSLSCGGLIARFRSPAGGLSLGALFIAVPVGIAIGGYRLGLWVPLLVLESAGIVPVIFGVLVNYASEGRQKRFIKKAFAQYLSPKVIDQLVRNPERLKLGGERKTLSIFFSDLTGFTSLSEKLKPEDLTRLLNEYLSAMTDLIHEEEGTVDKYEGDAIIAFWNAPLDVSDHAVRAVRAALHCQDRLAKMAPIFKKYMEADLIMRIGINTGEAVVGNMGSKNRFDYTMLGDAVNLASRLEGVNKDFGTHTLISKTTRDLLNNDFHCREIGRVTVVGRKKPVTVYEPMFKEQFAKQKEQIDEFAKGLQLFYQGTLDKARLLFSSIANHDPAAQAYVKRIDELEPSGAETWEGIWVMTKK
ncbi:MAG: adenylate/guanylate cyclase domain-containing protein [Pseudomonadota bacterium]